MEILLSVIAIAILGGSLGGILGWASNALKVEGDPRVDEINDLLPAGQCGQCGEAGCRQAAEAMVAGRLGPDCCPPGGRSLAQAVAGILGVSLAEGGDDIPVIAKIDESLCTGCGRCFKACPFDAIVGATRQMHTVMASVCTGCRLCEKACQQPDCLSLVPIETKSSTWQWPKPSAA